MRIESAPEVPKPPEQLINYTDCALVFCFNPNPQNAHECLQLLQAQANRGDQGFGIVLIDRNRISEFKMGNSPQNCPPESLPGTKATVINGHNRYSTTGAVRQENLQPFVFQDQEEGELIALSHNGNVINALDIAQEFLPGVKLEDDISDTLIITQAIWAHFRANGGSILHSIKTVLAKCIGSYSLIISTHEGNFLIRSPEGNRPLWVGWGTQGEVYGLSESAAFSTNTKRKRSVLPGEIVIIGPHGEVTSDSLNLAQPQQTQAFCSFETVYLARGDSLNPVTSEPHNATRRRFGENLGDQIEQTKPEYAESVLRGETLIAPIPNGGTSATHGLADRFGQNPFYLFNAKPFRSYIARAGEHKNVSSGKLSIKEDLILPADVKRILLIDDSLVRGSVSHGAIPLVKNWLIANGYSDVEVDFAVASPMPTRGCNLGIVMYQADLFTHRFPTVQQQLQALGVSHLFVLEYERYLQALHQIDANKPENPTRAQLEKEYCTYCMGVVGLTQHPFGAEYEPIV